MRIASTLALALVLAVTGCASKKPDPQTPANKAAADKDKGSMDSSTPDDKSEMKDPKTSDDPCGG